MAPLENPRHEKVARARAAGKPKSKAYAEAGYAPHPSSATALLKNPKIANRIEEIKQEQYVALTMERKAIIRATLENVDIAMGKKPVCVGKDATPVHVYRGDVANNALKMLANELDLFREKTEHRHFIQEFDKYSDMELVQILSQEANALLELEDKTGEDSDDDSGPGGASG